MTELPLFRVLCQWMLIVGAALCCWPNAAAMPQKYRFQHINSLDGLHQNSVYSLFESDSSMLWVGTQDGLHRYNGTDFTLFRPQADDPTSISDSFIVDMLQQGNTLWVGTVSGGVNALDLTTGKFKQLTIKNGKPSLRIYQLAIFNDQLWAATEDGLYRQSAPLQLTKVELGPLTSPVVTRILSIDSQTLLLSTEHHGAFLYRDGRFNPFPLPDGAQQISQGHVAADNAVWLALGSELWRYPSLEQPPQRIFKLTDHRQTIRDFIFDHQHGVWLGGIGTGLVHLLPRQGQWFVEKIQHQPDEQDSLSDNDITSLLLDRQGNLWVGSYYSGLNRINIDRQYFAHIYNKTDTQRLRRNNNIRAICRAGDGQLYVGTNDSGLFRLTDSGKFESLNALFMPLIGAEASDDLRVLDIAADTDNSLWLATSAGLFQLALPNTLMPIELPQNITHIRAISLDSSKHQLWFAAQNALYRYDIANKQLNNINLQYATPQPDSAILNLRRTRSGLWVMTMNGLYQLASNGDLIRYFSPQELPHPIVRDVLEMDDGNIWIATHGGLVLLQDGELTNFSATHKLSNNTIYALADDHLGNVWFTSNAGVSRLEVASGKFLSFNENEGLQSLEFNGGVRWQDPDGSIWFGGINGINYFQPSKIPAARQNVEIALASYRIGEQLFPLYRFTDNIYITQHYSNELLSFKVTPIDFSYPNHHQYSFLLKGLESNWHPFEAMNEISYTAVPAGSYQLLVRHKLTGSAEFSQQQLADITIIAPWYRTPSAYVLYCLFCVIMIALLARHYVKKWHEEKQIQQQISDSHERFKLAMWGSGDRLWDWHLVSETLTMTQLSQDNELTQQLTRQQYLALIHPEDRQVLQQTLARYLAGKIPYFEAEYRSFSADGEWRWRLDRGKIAEVGIHNTPIRIAGTSTDITDRKQQEDELKLSHQVLESMNEAVVICDLDYRVISVNRAFSETTGYQESCILGKYCLALTRGLYPINHYRDIERILLTEHHWSGEIELRQANGTVILAWLEVNQVVDHNAEASHLVMVFNDITDRKKVEEDLRLLANYDPLTGLPNRTLFKEHLKHALDQAQRNGTKVALLFLDLDRFKTINDSKGHHVGDELLKAVGQRLAGAVRAGDTVARIGGDEFTIILEGVAKAKAATVIAEKIIHLLDQPFELSQNTLDITTSIGISLSPDDTCDVQELLKYADTAMYHAKSMGRNNFQFYSSHMNVSAVRHLQLETGLKQAISKNELEVMYQPKYSVTSGCIVGCEALMRWHSNELGPVSPAEFIPLAEETGLITSIGSWLLDHVAQQMNQWRQQGVSLLPVAVNISAKQLQHELLTEIEQILLQYQLPAQLLEIELTESAVMKHPKQSIAILNRLEALGLSLAVDDFGTGYSSLAYLKRFPINTLKIDREFVRDISEDPDDAAITSAIIALAHSLELQVVAEGVETEEQLQYLASQGCDQIQGFLLSKPLAASDYLALLLQQQARA